MLKSPWPTLPYTFSLRDNNPALLDVELLNPFNGVDVSNSQRPSYGMCTVSPSTSACMWMPSTI